MRKNNYLTVQDAEKDIERLIEISFRKEAQKARGNIQESSQQTFRKRLADLKIDLYSETAISIFSWENIPENFTDFLNSKRIERQILRFPAVCVFEHTYEIEDSKGNTLTEKQIFCLPFKVVSGSINCYGEFTIVQPFAQSGRIHDFPELVVNKNCVILSDTFGNVQTTDNHSSRIKEAIEFYSKCIADCEINRIINRNWLKIPILFSIEKGADKKIADRLALEVKQIIQAIEDNESAVVSEVVENLKVFQTGINYYGKELLDDIKSYENELLAILGISNLGYQKSTTRQSVPEIDKNADSYNINITKRLQVREMALKNLKKIFPKYFEKVTLKVNLNAFYEGVETLNEQTNINA